MKKLVAILSAISLLLTATYCGILTSAAESEAPKSFVQSFEDDTLSLSNGNFSFSDEEARTGSKSLKLVKDSSSSTDNSFAAVFLKETDAITADAPYMVSFYIKPVTVAGEIELQFYRNGTVNSHSGNSGSDRISKFNFTAAQIEALPVDENGWYKVVVSSEFYRDEAKPYMNFWNCQWNGNATFYIDDITFEPILAPEIEENLLKADEEHWSFGKKWSSTGFDGDNIKLTGGTGVATFIGKTVGEETIRVKLNSSVSTDWAGVAFRNQADLDAMRADGQNGYFYDIGNSYVVQWNAAKLSLKYCYKEGESSKWDNMAGPIDFNMQDGKDHTIEIRTKDDTVNNSTYIEVYVDGILRLSATDSLAAVKPAGYVQVVASHKDDAVTVKGFEIAGEKVETYVDTTPPFVPATDITENLLNADSQNWIFGREWSPATGIKNGVLTVTGGTGIATFTGKKFDTQSIVFKLAANLGSEWAAMSFRNQVTVTDLEKNGQNGYFMSSGNAYALLLTKDGVSVKVAFKKDKWENLGEVYAIDLSDGKEHLYQVVIEDLTESKATNIKVYIDGVLCIDCTDSKYAIKDSGYTSFVCSNKADSITVNGFEVLGEKLADYQQGAPVVSGNNLVKNTNTWYFYKGWNYEGYTGTTGSVNGNITVSGDYGTALYQGQKIGQSYVEMKFNTKLSDKGMVFIGLRNAVTSADLEKDKSAANTMSAKSDAYVLRLMKSGIALGIKGEDGNFKTLGTKYEFESGFDINGQENTLITRILDDADAKSSRIEVWLNGERIMVYIDSEYAVKANGYYSVTVADGKNNSDSLTITSFKIGVDNLSPNTGDTTVNSNAILLLVAAVMMLGVCALVFFRKEKV